MQKSFPKILTILFLSIFIVQLFGLVLLFTLPQASQAAGINFTPQVQGLTYTFNNSDNTTGNIANYIKAIYQYAIGIVGILAAVVLMYGGVLWIVAGGSSSQVGEAKAWIGAALTGLILALTSYLILYTVNPALVNLQTSEIKPVAELKTGSCTTTTAGVTTCVDGATSEGCKPPSTFAPGGTCPKSCCAFTKGGMLECNDKSTATDQACRDAITNAGGVYHSYVGAIGSGGMCSSVAGQGCVAKQILP